MCLRLKVLRWLAVVVAVLAASACRPAGAYADGDPASDYLYSQWAFVPAGTRIDQQLQLDQTVAEARRHGFPIKVAVIGSPSGLGSVGALWNRPGLYARFLGTELSLRYQGPLLIVMPSGLGVYRAGHSETAPGTRIAPGQTGLVAAAVTAVRELAVAAGHPLPAARLDTPRASERSEPSGAQELLLGVGVLLIAVAWGLSLWCRPPGASSA